jgi:hypothetical protein
MEQYKILYAPQSGREAEAVEAESLLETGEWVVFYTPGGGSNRVLNVHEEEVLRVERG